MPIEVEKEQQAIVSHRMNFFGRPSPPNSISWQYKGLPCLLERPDDGQAPVEHTVRCGVCEKTLTYTVHSVATTRRRQARWRACAYAGLIVLIGGVASVFIISGAGPVRIVPGIYRQAVPGRQVRLENHRCRSRPQRA